jgi:ATP-dependent DNA helicase RecG
MAITIEQIERWRIESSEHQNLEFKEARNAGLDSKKLFKYCVAIANEGGGYLVYGIKDAPIPRPIVGTCAEENPRATAEKIFNNLHFRVEIEEIAHPEGRVVVFTIPSRPTGTAYSLEGAYWMRSGEELKPMSEDRLRRIFAEGQSNWLEQPAKKHCDDAEVISLLDTQIFFDLLKLPYPTTRQAVLERFAAENLIQLDADGWNITRMGALLFAKHLLDFEQLALKAPRVVVYDGTGKLKTKLDYVGSKGYAVGFQGLVEFVNNQLPVNEVIEQALRHESRMLPAIAVRELVANALIHQDFEETGFSVMIEIYDNRLEISNPGKPLIAEERFIDENKSRNERLADLARRLGICEVKGSGIDKVIQAAEFFQLPAPVFKNNGFRTIAVLFAPKSFEKTAMDDRIRACYQHCCLRYVCGESMTNQTLRARFKLPADKMSTISALIAATVAKNRIKPSDPKQTRHRAYLPFWA